MPRPMAARPRLVPLLLVASLVALAPPVARAADPPAAAAPEDGVVVLPDANIIQALVGDLDADGHRELLRLTSDVDGATYLEVWHLKGRAWGRIGEPLRLLAGTAGPDLNRVYGGAPARLIAWNDGESERVLLLTQPRFEELGAAPPCCALLHDVRIERGGVTTESIGDASNSVDALLALDLDGDGRDELLATRSLRPLGDISFPMEARVYRFDGERFGPPVIAELPFGSGDTPFILGETDGVSGDEAAIISTLGPPGLFRLALGADDVLGLEPAQFPRATAAAAVPLVDGPGIVVAEGGRQAVLARWPAGGVPEPIATSLAPGDLLGVAETARGVRILLAEKIPSKVHVLGPDLRFAPGPSLRETAAVAQLAARGMASYAGELPGGGLDGRPALVYGGRMVGALPADHAGPRYDVGTIASFAGAAPVGIAGDGSWMAVMHAQFGVERLARHGGRIDEPRPHAGGWMTIAPLAEVLSPEGESSAALDPPTIGLSDGPNAGSMFAGGNGFSAEIAAPAGSVVVVVGNDQSSAAEAARRVIPEAGHARVAFPPPPGANPRYRPGAVVLTPAGHGYIASWEVQVLNEPPRVSVQAMTPFGSANVALTGTVRPRSQVTIAGGLVDVEPDGSFSASVPTPPWPTDVVIAAVDPVGNEATLRLDVVGFLDYRGLPWIPLVAVIPAIAAAVLFLRAPRPRPGGPEPADDAALEELEPDEQPG